PARRHDDHFRAVSAILPWLFYRLNQLVSRVAKQVAQDLPVILLVLYDEDALAHGSFTCRSTFTGIVNANVEPLPTLDSTQMRPPCIPMVRLAIDRPRPVPPFRLVAVLSACWNSSKIFPWSEEAMPGPVSRTATVRDPLSPVALIATSPSYVNLIAFPTRFSRTWASRRPSPWPMGRLWPTSVVRARFFPAASDPTAETTVSTTSLSE